MNTYTPPAGTHISAAIRSAIEQATATGEAVSFNFNDITVYVNPGDDPDEVYAGWQAEADVHHAAWEASEDGKQAARQAREAAEAAECSAAEGVRSFTCTDADGWQKSIDANTDGYGACVIRYAARWANMAEAAIGSSAPSAEIFDRTSHEADTEGITGFMYGCAVSLLSQVWMHGAALKQWHNGEYGRPDADGVVNPAIITVSAR